MKSMRVIREIEPKWPGAQIIWLPSDASLVICVRINMFFTIFTIVIVALRPYVTVTIIRPVVCYIGTELLSERHEGGHLCSSQPQSVQWAPGVPFGQRRVLTCSSHALYDESFGTGRSALPHRGVHWLVMLYSYRLVRSNPRRRSGRNFGWA